MLFELVDGLIMYFLRRSVFVLGGCKTEVFFKNYQISQSSTLIPFIR